MAVLEWDLPEMQGVDILRRLRSRAHKSVYAIMLTSRDRREDIVYGLNAGADDYLTKPVDMQILKMRIKVGERILGAIPPEEWSLPRVPGYDVKSQLGKGSFGTVWHAVMADGGLDVALKIIRPGLLSRDALRRFSREVDIMKGLNHRCIALLYDSRFDDRYCYYAMEYVDGRPIRHHCKRYNLEPQQIVRLICELGEALAYAHGRGVIHRDLSLSNILVSRRGVPKLIDFGLAKHVDAIDESTTRTLNGVAVGTPVFASPEAARGIVSSIDHRSDIYSLATVLYVLLLREHPKKLDRGNEFRLLRSVIEGEARHPSQFDPHFDPKLADVLLRALHNDPDDRHDTAEAFLADLKAFRD